MSFNDIRNRIAQKYISNYCMLRLGEIGRLKNEHGSLVEQVAGLVYRNRKLRYKVKKWRFK